MGLFLWNDSIRQKYSLTLSPWVSLKHQLFQTNLIGLDVKAKHHTVDDFKL